MGYLSPLSPSQMRKARLASLRLLTQLMRCALRLAAASAGSNMAARMAMIAITTSSSMSVNAFFCLTIFFILILSVVGCYFYFLLFGDSRRNLLELSFMSTEFLKFYLAVRMPTGFW